MALVLPSNLGALLVTGLSWSPGQFTYSIPTAGSVFSYTGEPNDPGYGVFSSEQAARFVASIAAWDRLIAPNFTQTNDLTTPGTIRIAFTKYDMDANTWGFAYYPSGSPRGGDIWINTDFSNTSFPLGGFDFNALLHEIGHALGLEHTFVNPGFSLYDNTTFSVMAYDDVNYLHRFFAPTGGGGLQATSTTAYPSTPMVADIQAIQQIYGADPTTESGDTVYKFDQSKAFLQAIYDAGGVDTIDLSDHTRGSILDLTPGSYSDVAKYTTSQQAADAIALYGAGFTSFINDWLNKSNTHTWTNNLGIAFSTTIENAKGGSGNDQFTGNAVANLLDGGGGDDFIQGLGGDDVLVGGKGQNYLVGGSGTDTVDYGWAGSGVLVDLGNTFGHQTTGVSSDRLETIENVTGTAFKDKITGDGLANRLIGGFGADTLVGLGGADILSGGSGSDLLNGGAGDDTIDGGAGDVDVAYFDALLADVTLTKGLAAGAWTVTSASGTDTVTGVEIVRFNDFEVDWATGSMTKVVIPTISKRITITSDFTVAKGVHLLFQDEGAFYLDGLGGVSPSLFNEGKITIVVDAGATQGVSSDIFGNSKSNLFHNKAGAEFTMTVNQVGSSFGLDANNGPTALINDGLFSLTSIGNAVGFMANHDTFAVFNNTGTMAVSGVAVNDEKVLGAFLRQGGTFTNSGKMTVHAGGGLTGIGVGAWIEDRKGVVDNSGTLVVTDSGSKQSIGVRYLDGSEFTFTNSGLIQADIALEVALYAASASMITNASTGVLKGDVNLSTGPALPAGTSIGFAVVNDGLIEGNVRLGDFGSTFDGSKGSVTGTVSGGTGVDILTGGAGKDVLVGNDGATKALSASDGADVIHGGAGDDILSGSGGADQLFGDADNDILKSSLGANLLDGGSGKDLADYSASKTALTLDMSVKGPQVTSIGTDTWVSIEGLIGSAFADKLTGNDEANTLDGGAGNDILIGGLGDDLLIGGLGLDLLEGGAGVDTFDGGIVDYRTAAGVITAKTGVNGTQATGGAGTDNFLNIQAIWGGAFDDVLSAVAGASSLFGGAGDDTLTGGDSADFLSGGGGLDTLAGGKGDDVLSNANQVITTAIVNDMTKGGGIANMDGGAGTDLAELTFLGDTRAIELDVSDAAAAAGLFVDKVKSATVTGIERVTIRSGAGNDRFIAGAGDDFLDAGAGNDILAGGKGANQLIGGSGTDTADYSAATLGVKVNLSVATAQSTGWGTDTLNSIEQVFGSLFGDTLTGGAGAELFRGDAGNDVINGGGGTDVAAYDMDSANAKWSFASGAWTVNAGVLGVDTLTGVEVLRFKDKDVTLVVPTPTPTPSPTPTPTPVDVLAPTLVSSSPSDNAAGVQPSGNLTLTFSEGVKAGSGTITLHNPLGGSQVIQVTNASVVSFSGSTVTINPPGDLLPGNDYWIEVSLGAIKDIAGNNFVGISGAATLNFTTVPGDINGLAGVPDLLTGGSGPDKMNGLDGDDILVPGAGDDTVDGGTGVDTAVFSGVRTSYTIAKTGKGATITGPDGVDTILNVEWLKFGDQTIRFRPGDGTLVNVNDNPTAFAGALRDFDGNDLGSASGWKLIGSTDIQKDGDNEFIFVNQTLGRWASIGPAEDGLVYFGDHGWGGDTRVVGIYIDPLVQTGEVQQGGPFDSQRRFANDLTIGNIKGVLGGGDYDKDGFQEVYFSLSDGSAFLHAYMHADGNIRYANYQSQQQVIDFLTANGFSASTWAGWF